MKLQNKLIAGFGLVALITLVVAGIGYWQTERLASALYEVGVVRLPSLQGLDMMGNAMTAIEDSSRSLQQPGLNRQQWNEETKRQAAAWVAFDRGWKIYEPLPQTPEEARLWREFVPAVQAWRTECTALSSRTAPGNTFTVGPPPPTAVPKSAPPGPTPHLDRVRTLLGEITALNHRVTDQAKAHSIASYRDVSVVRGLMLATALAGVLGAIGLAVLLGRRISRPVTEISHALASVGRGDLNVQLQNPSADEIGQAARGLNQMVESMRNTHEMLHALGDNLPGSMLYQVVREPDGQMRFRYVSAGIERLHGISVEEALRDASALYGQVLPEDRPALQAAEAASLETLAIIELEARMRRPDGAIRWVHLCAQPRRLPDGRTLWDGIETDVTDIHLTALALAESRERLSFALQVSQLGVWRRNLQTGVIEWDMRMFAIFGVDPSGGVPDYDAFLQSVVPEDRAAVGSAWQRFIAGGAPFEVQFRIRRPDGQIRHIRAQSALHRGAGDQPSWIVGVDADLTEFIHTTEETGRLREQLRQAQKMETLGTLAAGVAHDFNNLLTGINGFIDLSTVSLPPDHEVVGLLRQARQGANSARDLVRRILSFSRSTQEMERQVAPLALVVRDTAPLIAASLPAQVTLKLDVDDSAPAVRADLGQIQQVLLNLCVNGAQAIGAASGSLHVGVTGRTVTAEMAAGDGSGPGRPGPYACLSVADTGCGMSPEVSAQVFEPFFTTKQPGEGTGLGLAIVKEIVTSHGGFVRVQSEVGRGTTFEVFLPAAVDSTVAAPIATPDDLGRQRGHGECIFIVDDEPAVLSIVQTTLERSGFTTEVFADSPAAWERFKSNPAACALLLTDLQMPGLSGVEFALRARRHSATLPIVIMTARTEVLNLAKLREIGGVGVLAKPFGIGELLEKVTTSLPAREGTETTDRV